MQNNRYRRDSFWRKVKYGKGTCMYKSGEMEEMAMKEIVIGVEAIFISNPNYRQNGMRTYCF